MQCEEEKDRLRIDISKGFTKQIQEMKKNDVKAIGDKCTFQINKFEKEY